MPAIPHASPIMRTLIFSSLLVIASCGSDSKSPGTDSTTPDYWPTAEWQIATPESRGFPAGALASLETDAASDLPFHTSLLVIKDGYLVHESYHDTGSETGNDKNTLHNVWSITKSVTSMILGRAWTKGDLDNIDIRAGDLFSDSSMGGLVHDDPRKDITLRHALQMRSGLAWNENSWLLREEKGKDPLLNPSPACLTAADMTLCSILQKPQAYEPGSVWNYSTYDSYLVSAFFKEITDQQLGNYANDNLFTPLGIDAANTYWPILSPLFNYTFGGGLLNIRSRDLAKLGMLILYEGQWDGQQLISKEWLDMSLAPQGNGLMARFGEDEEPVSADELENQDIRYGMQWWRKTGPGMDGLDAITARGLGGQQMHIFREKGLIVLITSDSQELEGQDRSTAINNFVRDRIESLAN